VFRRREVQLLAHADRVKRLAACKRLSRRLTVAKLARTWFTDEKIFTVQTPTNSQNDRVYANVAVKRDIPSERLLKGRKHFSQSIMVSVAVLQLGKSSLVFVERGAKVNSSYYCDVVLHQGLLPDIIAHSGHNFTSSRMEHLLIVHEKQLLFSLLTFQTLLNQKIGHRTVRT